MERVPVLSIAMMAVSCAVAFAIPVLLFLYFRKRKGADVPPFWIGCVVFLAFALVLESAVHRLILGSAAGAVIRGSLWLYAAYGGLMAGLFEETGRLLAFCTVLKKYRDRDVDALMYGAGHGGFEAAAVLGITMLSNLAYSLLINLGGSAAVTAPLSGDQLAQVEAAFATLITTPPLHFLVGSAERVFAAALQLALSVLVWFAVKDRRSRALFPLAILIHALVDAVTVLLAGWGVPLLLLEALIGVLAALTALLARRVWTRRVSPSA